VNAAQRQITRAAGTVMAAFVLSNLTGLARQILIANYFGTSGPIDAFYAAQRLPDLLFNLVAGGALASAFVPAFTGLLAKEDKAGAWRLASGVMSLVALALIAVSALAAVFAPTLIRYVLAPGYAADAAKFELAVSLLRLLLLSPAIFGVSGLLMGILNAHQKFLAPALAPTFYWLGMIFGLLFLRPSLGIYGLAWGAVLGAVLHLLVQLPGLLGLQPQLRFAPSLANPAVREVFTLMGPRLLGVAAVQLNFVVSAALASYWLEGSYTALNVAWQVFTMPQVIIAQAISIAALPTFSAMVARGELAAMRAALAETVRMILFLALPATLGLIFLSTPIIAFLFQRSEFTASSTQLVASALTMFTLGLASHSLVEILSRSYYALKDTWTPVWVGAGAMALNILLNFPLATYFQTFNVPHAGLALANTLATTLEMFLLTWLLRRRLSGLDLGRVWPGLLRTLAASVVTAGVLWLWVTQTAEQPAWLAALGGVTLGGAAFGLAAYALKTPEAQLAVETVRKIFYRDSMGR